jgi:hypothetical protein
MFKLNWADYDKQVAKLLQVLNAPPSQFEGDTTKPVKRAERKDVYSDSLTSVGNMLGSSFAGIDKVATQVDLQRQANSKFDIMIDKITLSNTYLESLQYNKGTNGLGIDPSLF